MELHQKTKAPKRHGIKVLLQFIIHTVIFLKSAFPSKSNMIISLFVGFLVCCSFNFQI